MRIPVLVEPEYMDALWCRQTLEGIGDACAKKKYTYFMPAMGPLLAGQEGICSLAVLVGTSESWVPGTVRKLLEHGIRAVVVSYLDPSGEEAAATVTMAHGQAMGQVMDYLFSCGRRKTALYGINANSSADQVKLRAFLRRGGREEDIWWNTGSLGGCADAFFPRAQGYDSVVLANDIVAVSFLQRAAGQGVAVPGELYAVSFGGCQIARHMRPSLTTLSLDHRALGRQAVAAYRFLCAQREPIHMNVQIPCVLMPGETTQNRPVPENGKKTAAPQAAQSIDPMIDCNIDFYQDPQAREILLVERLLGLLDELDLQILRGIRAGRSYEALAEENHASEGTVKYRLNRMLRESRQENRAQLEALLGKYLGPKL